MRLACLYVPAFPLAALCRADPELRGSAVAVTEGSGPRARVVAVSTEAERHGITVGLSAAQALAIHDGLVVRPAHAGAERSAQAALRDTALSFSPRFEEAGSGTVYVDCSGLSFLYKSEDELAAAMANTAEAMGLPAAVGIASTKLAARLAAERGTITVIPPQEEWRFLAPLSVRALNPDPDTLARLTRWGILRIGDLAGLPLEGVAARLGPQGALLVRRARGEDERPLVAMPMPLEFEESISLDYGVDSLEAFLFIVRGLLDRLVVRLTLRGFVCGDLHLTLRLLNGGCDARTVVVAAPNNDTKSLLTLVRLHLESHPPADVVESVSISAGAEKLRAAQLDLFGPKRPVPERLAVTLARLYALCGKDAVGVPVVANSHCPDAYGLCPMEPEDRKASGNPPYPPPMPKPRNPALAVRAIRPPRRLEVFTDRGRPDFIRIADEQGFSGCSGRVVTYSGPWRVQGDWWNPAAYARDYYDVQLSDGGVYRVYRDERSEWFVDGAYD